MKVATGVATPSNSYTESLSENLLLPLEENHQDLDIAKNRARDRNAELPLTKNSDEGSNTETKTYENQIQESFQSVATPVATPLLPQSNYNHQNTHQPTVSAMEGQAGTMEEKSHTLHKSQSHTGQDVEPSKTSNMEGMEDMEDMEGKNNLREGEIFINSTCDNLSLSQKIIQVWNDPPILGRIVLAMTEDITTVVQNGRMSGRRC